MTQRQQYILTDSSDYKIEGVFGINDQILMLSSQISTMKGLINFYKDIETQKHDKFQTCRHEKEDQDEATTATSQS